MKKIEKEAEENLDDLQPLNEKNPDVESLPDAVNEIDPELSLESDLPLQNENQLNESIESTSEKIGSIEKNFKSQEESKSEEESKSKETRSSKFDDSIDSFVEPLLNTYKETHTNEPMNSEHSEEVLSLQTTENPSIELEDSTTDLNYEIDLAVATSTAPTTKPLIKKRKINPVLSAFQALSHQDLETLKKFFNMMADQSKKTKRSFGSKRAIPHFPFPLYESSNDLVFSSEQEEQENEEEQSDSEESSTEASAEEKSEPPPTIPSTKKSRKSPFQQQKRQASLYGQPAIIQAYPILSPPLLPPPAPHELFANKKSSSSNSGSFFPAPIPSNSIDPPQKPQWMQRLENESSAERTSRLQNNLQRLIQFISLLSHVDGFLATRTKSVVKKLVLLLDDEQDVDEQFAERRKRWDSLSQN